MFRKCWFQGASKFYNQAKVAASNLKATRANSTQGFQLFKFHCFTLFAISAETKEHLEILLFHFHSLAAPAPTQKRPLSTLTRSPAVCSASAESSSRRPCRSAQALSRPSTPRYTPPLPPPPLRPRRWCRPPCLTRWRSPRLPQLLHWPRATPSLSTTACSSLRACPSISAKVSSRAHAGPDWFRRRFMLAVVTSAACADVTLVRINLPRRFVRRLRLLFAGCSFTGSL